MNPTMAKLSAAASAFLIAAAVVILWVTSHPGAGATTVKAEFEDAFPILAGMNVRMSGAVAGSVREVELTEAGTAMVTLSLNEGTVPPKSDASAAIRQQDITGDSYVSLSPGGAADPLDSGVIPVERTLVAPRFDDLLNSFGEEERQALRLILVEAGKALERRGEDLNRAALELRPALDATNRAVSELGEQNHALRSLIGDAENVTGQVAERSAAGGRLVDSLAEVLEETAGRSPDLDRALERLPETTSRTKVTLGKLRQTAVAATPLARALGKHAPQLGGSVEKLGPFLADSRAALDNFGPTFRLSGELFRDARPTLQVAPDHVLTAPFELAGGVDELLRTLLGNEDVLKLLFGADAYGQAPGNADDVGLGAIGVETGAQLGYENSDPARNFLRAVVVPSCELFGRPIKPGCLSEAVDLLSSQRDRDRKEGREPLPLPAMPQAPPTILDDAAGSPPQVGGMPLPQVPGPGGPPPTQETITSLLDFLFGRPPR